MATAFHCMKMWETCRYKTEKNCNKNSISTVECEKKVKEKCPNPKKWVTQKPDKLCDPSNLKMYVTVGAHYNHDFKHHHKLRIKEVHAPIKRGGNKKHDFAILVLNEPVPDFLEQRKQGKCR